MGVVKITFDGSSVSASQDAVLNHFLSGNIDAGIFEGIGSELSYSVSNNYITFQDGYVQVYGRRMYVEAGSQVYISLDSVRYGYVILDVNLSSNSVTLTKVESSGIYPSLIQNNLLTGGTRYQFPIAKYSKNTSSITMQSFTRTMIPTSLSQANSGYNRAVSYVQQNYRVIYIFGPDYRSGSTYRWNFSDQLLGQSIIIVNIENRVQIPLTGIFITGNSVFSIDYRLHGADHTLYGEWSTSGMLLLNTNSTSIDIENLVLIKMGN